MSSKKKERVIIPEISEITSPDFLHELSYKDLDVLADKMRTYILEMTSKNGGHLSSNLGVIEATIALHRVFDFKKDKLIFDVGHQCYTHKVLSGRGLETLRKKDGVSGFQKVNESIYDPFDAGHSSTSISVAQGLAIARDMKGEDYEVIAFIGDGSIASGLAFEGLNNLGHSKTKVIIILNDNEMSISRPVGGLGKTFAKISTGVGYNKMKSGFSRVMNKTKVGHKIYEFFRKIKNWIKFKLIPATYFDNLGFTFLGPVDGHNIKAMEKIINKAKKSPKSTVIHICTKKGKGYSYAEKDETGYWHGVSPFDIESGKPLNMHPGVISWSHVLSDIVLESMEKDDKVVLISPATLKGSGLENIFEKYPDRSFDVGIAEEHAATMAGGLAISGYHPVLDIYSTFLQRAYDEVSHDIARLNLPTTILVDRAGLVGADGETHQGIYDVAAFMSVPNTVITMPSTKDEAKALYYESLKQDKVFFIRFPREFTSDKPAQDMLLPYGKWIKLMNDSKKERAIISVGPRVRELANELEKKHKEVTVYNALYMSIIDEEAMSDILGHKEIIIYDSYSIIDGFARFISSELMLRGYKGKVIIKAIPKTFVKQATIDEQLGDFGLTVKDIVKLVS